MLNIHCAQYFTYFEHWNLSRIKPGCHLCVFSNLEIHNSMKTNLEIKSDVSNNFSQLCPIIINDIQLFSMSLTL